MVPGSPEYGGSKCAAAVAKAQLQTYSWYGTHIRSTEVAYQVAGIRTASAQQCTSAVAKQCTSVPCTHTCYIPVYIYILYQGIYSFQYIDVRLSQVPSDLSVGYFRGGAVACSVWGHPDIILGVYGGSANL